MTVKGRYDSRGLPTTWGVPALQRHVARKRARRRTACRRGRSDLRKTNVRSICRWQLQHAILRHDEHPWDVTRGPEDRRRSRRVAARLSASEAGSDIGSSIRTPAHFCACTGHKRRGHRAARRTGAAWQKAGEHSDVVGPHRRASDDLSAGALRMAPDAIGSRRWRCAPSGHGSSACPSRGTMPTSLVAVTRRRSAPGS